MLASGIRRHRDGREPPACLAHRRSAGPMKMLLLVLIRRYQYTLRPLLGAHCRFAPSCSEYAHEAIATHGVAARRLARGQADRALPPVSSGRPRSRARRVAQDRLLAPLVHGYPAPHPALHLRLVRGLPVAKVAGRAPPPPAPTSAQPAGVTPGASDVPAVPGTKAPSAATPPPLAATVPSAGKPITITTDLFRAEIDTTGGVIAEVALLKHRDPGDEAKPYLALLRTPERTNIAASGLLGEGMPNHRTVYEALPGPRELAAGGRFARAHARGHREERRQGPPGIDLPPRQLRDRRRLRGDQRG